MKSIENEIEKLEESIKNLATISNNTNGLYKAKILKKEKSIGVRSVDFKKSKYSIYAIFSFFLIVPLVLPFVKKNAYSSKENIMGAIFLIIFGIIITIIVNNRTYYRNKLKISIDGVFYNHEIVPLDEILVVFLEKQVRYPRDSKYYLYLGLSNSQVKIFEVTGLAENGKGLATVPDNRAKIGHWIEFYKSTNKIN